MHEDHNHNFNMASEQYILHDLSSYCSIPLPNFSYYFFLINLSFVGYLFVASATYLKTLKILSHHCILHLPTSPIYNFSLVVRCNLASTIPDAVCPWLCPRLACPLLYPQTFHCYACYLFSDDVWQIFLTNESYNDDSHHRTIQMVIFSLSS
jgi:hypothetical protein